MKILLLIGMTNLLFLASVVVAQVVPTPVINNEIRDNSSIRSREIELERVKRDFRKPKITAETNGRVIKFSEIKEDFEKIQKTQNSIVKIYTTGKEVYYEKIGKLSMEINESAIRLNSNLFETPKPIKRVEKPEAKNLKSVKEVIIELDNYIEKFVKSSMFQNLRVIDTKVSEKTRFDLEKIIELSFALNRRTNEMAQISR